MKSPSDLVRSCFAAYEQKDWQALEAIIASDFTFTSPLDDAISRECYFERCWPNSAHLDTFRIENLMEDGNKVFVQYQAYPRGKAPFRNTELFTVRDGLITGVQVFFGSESDATEVIEGKEQIRTLIDQWAGGIARKDVDLVASLTDPKAVRFYLAPPLEADQPLNENLEEWFGTFEGEIGYEIRQLGITAADGLAYSHSLHHLTGRKKAGEAVDLWFRETMCFRKTDDRWIITHAHESVPFLMDGSGRAALNLKPVE